MWGDRRTSGMTGRMVAGLGGMAWSLRLVETGIDRLARVVNGMDIRPLGGLGDIANLGLTLPEAKHILARPQQAVVAAQADDHVVPRPDCPSCGVACRVKDWRVHRVPQGLRRWRQPPSECSAQVGDRETIPSDGD